MRQVPKVDDFHTTSLEVPFLSTSKHSERIDVASKEASRASIVYHDTADYVRGAALSGGGIQLLCRGEMAAVKQEVGRTHIVGRHCLVLRSFKFS